MIRDSCGMTPENIVFLCERSREYDIRQHMKPGWMTAGNMSTIITYVDRKKLCFCLFGLKDIDSELPINSCGVLIMYRFYTRKMSAYLARESTPSWILAPSESLRPTTGAPTSAALSMIGVYARECVCVCVWVSVGVCVGRGGDYGCEYG